MNENAQNVIPQSGESKLIRVQRKLAVAKYVAAVCCAIFAVWGFFLCRNEIESDNFRYIIKYFDKNLVKDATDYKTMTYAFDKNAIFADYKGDVAILSEGQLTLYNIGAKTILSDTLSLSSEKQLVSGDTYLIIYETGKTDYSVYNTFDKIYDGKTQYPVYAIHTGKNGDYAIVTYSESYICEVYFYGKDFKKKYYWKSTSKLVTDIKFSDSGDDFLLTCVTTENTQFKSVVEYRSYNSDSAKKTYEISDEFAMSSVFAKGSGIAVTTDKATHFFTSAGKISASYPHEGIFSSKYALSDALLTVVRKSPSSDEYIFSSYSYKGNLNFSVGTSQKFLSVFQYGNYIYALSGDNTIKKYSMKSGAVMAEYEISPYAQDMLLIDGGYFLVFYKTETQLIKISDI